MAAAELAVNNAKQSSTGFTPFFLNSGQHVQLPLDQAIACLRQSNNPEAEVRIARLHAALELARSNIEQAQQRQAKYADQHRRDVTFVVGDSVLLSTVTDHLRMVGDDKRTPKFASKYIGPFKVKRVAHANAYELDLPASLQIYPVLNISRLKQYTDGTLRFPHRARIDHRPPAESQLEDGAAQFEVESILAKRGDGSSARYLVKWLGYPDYESTWEPASSLRSARDAVTAFEAAVSED